ncbi:MAG: ssDNA-binding Zn-finger/Zn-ribbon topoisomerase 1 [Candidatus Endobugula sp.]|jgi:ssDNA-binding Zn-finger/Zn-ribbon topoisomerase 1
MNNLLIPFGLDRVTNAIVEPEDADRGRACHCVCPGCHAPLLSRHPKAHRVHFAHDSKHPDAKPDEECPFSSAVAIAMMARELAESLIGKAFFIPEYDYCHQFECCGDTEDILVTEKKILTITSALKKPDGGGQMFDVELGFGEAKILVDLFYKGKPIQHVLNEAVLSKEKSGVLAISCDTFDQGPLAKDKQLKFSDAVLAFLLETGCRQWRFHPRQAALADRANASHQCRPSNNYWSDPADIDEDNDACIEVEYLSRTRVNDTELAPPFEPKRYQCIMCKDEWLQLKAGAPTCPRCHSHLFSVEV